MAGNFPRPLELPPRELLFHTKANLGARLFRSCIKPVRNTPHLDAGRVRVKLTLLFCGSGPTFRPATRPALSQFLSPIHFHPVNVFNQFSQRPDLSTTASDNVSPDVAAIDKITCAIDGSSYHTSFPSSASSPVDDQPPVPTSTSTCSSQLRSFEASTFLPWTLSFHTPLCIGCAATTLLESFRPSFIRIFPKIPRFNHALDLVIRYQSQRVRRLGGIRLHDKGQR